MYVLLRFLRTDLFEDYEAAVELLEEAFGAYVVGISSSGHLVFSVMLPISEDNQEFLMVSPYREDLCGHIVRMDSLCPN